VNIAFSAILIFSLLLPGLIFLSAYQNGLKSWISPDGGDSLARNIAGSLIASIFLHWIWIALAGRLGYSIDFQSALVFLTGYSDGKSDLFVSAIQSAARSVPQISLYYLTLYFFAVVLGFFSHWVVTWFEIDGVVPVLRQSNHWSYILSGRLSCFRECSQGFGGKPVGGVLVSAVVRHSEVSYLYRGLLVDWVCRSNGELDRIILESAHRRRLDKDRDSRQAVPSPGCQLKGDDRFYSIEGSYFILSYSDICTINFQYLPKVQFKSARRRSPANWWEFRRMVWSSYLKKLAKWRGFLKKTLPLRLRE